MIGILVPFHSAVKECKSEDHFRLWMITHQSEQKALYAWGKGRLLVQRPRDQGLNRGLTICTEETFQFSNLCSQSSFDGNEFRMVTRAQIASRSNSSLFPFIGSCASSNYVVYYTRRQILLSDVEFPVMLVSLQADYLRRKYSFPRALYRIWWWWWWWWWYIQLLSDLLSQKQKIIHKSTN